jgi:nitroimidazol reductase NimA-like FMN-containing flavoprotein (pyridoxamine 5'-phosphate oxidase superfamily)
MQGLQWKEVADRLAEARVYWVHTTGPGGTPNATPVWGVELREVLYFYTHSGTVKARNLEQNPSVVVHLESGSDVVLVHGRFLYMGHPSQHPDVVEVFEKKYDRPEERAFLPSSDPMFDVLYSLEPRRALTWTLPDSEASTRRWSAITSA